MNFEQPLFFVPNRVWRLYTGGLLIDRFTGAGNENDGHLPEEWLASTVLASNGEHTMRENEGLSSVKLEENESPLLSDLLVTNGELILGKKHFRKYGNNTAVLCKYLDSAVRLPIQCHPDVETSLRLFNSTFGKTESWHIISTRKINGEEPYILLGFKPGITATKFATAVQDQDLPGMIEMLHKIPVKAGDTYFVPPRMPHAIGTGVFMLEVQEPSDWVIQPEKYCADIQLSDQDMWGPLTQENGLQVFEYKGLSMEGLMGKIAPSNKIIFSSEGISVEELIGSVHTKAFGLWKVIIKEGAGSFKLPVEFALMVVENGSGSIRWSNKERKLKQSDYFLKPAALKDFEFTSDGIMEVLICLPPLVQ